MNLLFLVQATHNKNPINIHFNNEWLERCTLPLPSIFLSKPSHSPLSPPTPAPAPFQPPPSSSRILTHCFVQISNQGVRPHMVSEVRQERSTRAFPPVKPSTFPFFPHNTGAARTPTKGFFSRDLFIRVSWGSSSSRRGSHVDRATRQSHRATAGV